MAPEILFKRSYSYESDFYSLGVVLFELTMGRRPYQGKSRSEIREELMNKEICLGEFELPEGYSFELANLINKLLKKNPSERLGRNGVQEIKDHNFFKTMKWKKL
jgi:serum/glucocorticoid-regulated kinase 2